MVVVCTTTPVGRQPAEAPRHEHVHGVGYVVTEVVQDERALMGNDGLVRAQRKPSLPHVVVLAAREAAEAVETTADALEPAIADVMVEELAADAMHACLLRGEVPGLAVGFLLEPEYVMH